MCPFISITIHFQNESTAEDDDDGDDDDDEEVVTILPEDKYRMGSLEKMISVIAMLVEESRCERCCICSVQETFMLLFLFSVLYPLNGIEEF